MKALWLGILLTGFTSIARAAEPTIHVDLGVGTSIDLLLVPAGEFTQGSPADEPGRGTDEDQRTVRHTPDLYFSRTAITRGQWERFVAETRYRTEAEVGNSGGFGWDGNTLTQRKEFTWKNPGFPQDATHPVCLVTHEDAKAFCKWLEQKAHRKTSLPTEAQWEYACRAGTTTPWHSGALPDAWHKGNSGNGTHPADSNTPNAWGLIIGGNVSEWCLDWYGPYEAGPQTDPRQGNPNLSDKSRRVLRGGSWNRDAKNTRSAARFRADPRSRNADIGFRIVCAAEAAIPVVEMPLTESPSIPSVEAEHAPPVHVPAPEFHPMPSRKVGISWLVGLPCLLIPIGLVIMLVRFAARGQTRTSPFTSPSHTPPPRPDLSQTIRKVADGFWIKSKHPVGTPIYLSYSVGGEIMEQTLDYQPGPDGQFVYTGTAPEHISVVGSGSIPPPLPHRPPLFPDRDEPAHRERDRPTMFPPAY